jgi:hypothetical protein
VISRRWLLAASIPVVTGLWLAAPRTVPAQGPAGAVRVALLAEWAIIHNRAAEDSAAFGQALDQGVVDRTVFAWQRGVIPRQVVLAKPIRVLPEPEAAPLGGRGRWELAAVRPPGAGSAWTEIDARGPDGRPDDVLILEIGGERNTGTQVLETLLVRAADGRLEPRPLALPALFPGRGVAVIRAPFDRPVPARAVGRFSPVGGGADMLVVRSLVETVRNGDVTANGPADTAPFGGGDWREGDRVLLRIPAASLAAGVPALVLGWKDRTLQPDPDREFPRTSTLASPLVRR